MAYGDLIGDLSQAYMTSAERAAKNGVQSLTGGPIARASSQLPAAASLSSVAPAVAGQAQQSTQSVTQPASLADAAPKQTSFDASNTAPKYAPQQPQSLASLSPTAPIATPVQSPVASLADLAPGGSVAAPAVTPAAQQAVGLDSAYRPTGIGVGSNAIAARVGASGVPQFSNQPTDLASAAGATPVSSGAQMPTSLADLSPGGVSANPSAPLSSLGSAANLGDGIGTFSQSQAGDGQLATTRFNRAADLRDAYKAQDQLTAAQAAQTRDNNFTVVHDSSQPVTRREIKFDQDRAATTQSLAGAVNSAQAGIATQRQGVAADQQQRQANRLEDAFVAASSPNATAEQKQRYQALVDPTGANSLKTQQAQAQLANTLSEGQLKQQQLAQNTITQQQAAQDKVQAQAGQAATFDQALGSIDTLLGTKIDPKNPNGPRLDEDPGLTKTLGPIDGLIPNAPGTKGADFEARLDTLKAQTFLPQVAALRGTGALSDAEGKKLSDSVGALSTKMSEEAFRKSLAEVRATLQAAKDRAAKSGQAPASAAGSQQSGTPQASGGMPTVTTKAQADALPAGSVFIGPDGRQYRK